MGIGSAAVSRLRAWGLKRVLLGVVGLLAVWWGVGKIMPASVPTVAVSKRLLVQSIVATGRVRSLSRARLGPAVSGTVARVLVREGARVAAGQLLVQLDDAEERAQLAQAKAVLSQAEAGLTGMVELRESVAAAQLRSAEVAFKRADAGFVRTRRLVEAGATAADRLDAATQDLEAARSQRDIAEAQARAARGGGTDRRTAEAALEQARGAAAAALARLEQTRILAPAAGRVLTRDVEPGDAVQPGRVLLTLAVDGPTQLVAVPDEKDVARLREGQLATASADAYPGETFPARVTYVAASIDPAQGTVEIRLDVDSAPPYLLPDMTVSVQIETARRPDALVVPTGSVTGLTTAEPSVIVVRDGRATEQLVRLGVRGETEVEVLNGLGEGDQVLAPGAPRVAPGQRVRGRPAGGGA